jgi:hypothetical protein
MYAMYEAHCDGDPMPLLDALNAIYERNSESEALVNDVLMRWDLIGFPRSASTAAQEKFEWMMNRISVVLSRYTAQEMADALTAIFTQLYSQIEPIQFMSFADKPQAPSAFKDINDFTLNMQNWLILEVVLESRHEVQREKLSKVIEIGSLLWEQCNYQGVFIVGLAFGDPSVSWLWDSHTLEPGALAKWKLLYDSTFEDRFKKYRSSVADCIAQKRKPFLPILCFEVNTFSGFAESYERGTAEYDKASTPLVEKFTACKNRCVDKSDAPIELVQYLKNLPKINLEEALKDALRVSPSSERFNSWRNKFHRDIYVKDIASYDENDLLLFFISHDLRSVARNITVANFWNDLLQLIEIGNMDEIVSELTKIIGANQTVYELIKTLIFVQSPTIKNVIKLDPNSEKFTAWCGVFLQGISEKKVSNYDVTDLFLTFVSRGMLGAALKFSEDFWNILLVSMANGDASAAISAMEQIIGPNEKVKDLVGCLCGDWL